MGKTSKIKDIFRVYIDIKRLLQYTKNVKFVYTSVDKSMENEAHPIRVSVSEAARLFGVDPHTVRRALSREELRYIVVQGRYKINFESLLNWSQNRTSVKNKFNKKGLGQYVDQWKIRNKKYSPNPKIVSPEK